MAFNPSAGGYGQVGRVPKGDAMARVRVHDTDLVVRLSWWERIAARHRDVRVPIGAVRAVRIEPDWWRALRGERGRGHWSPDRWSVGERQVADGTDFVAVRARGPVLCLELHDGAPYRRLAVSVPDPEEVRRRLRREGPGPGVGG